MADPMADHWAAKKAELMVVRLAGYSVDSKADSMVGPMGATMVATKADC